MNTYGEVIDNVCVNLVIADQQWVNQQNNIFILSTVNNLAYIGAVVVDGQFTPKLYPPNDLPTS